MKPLVFSLALLMVSAPGRADDGVFRSPAEPAALAAMLKPAVREMAPAAVVTGTFQQRKFLAQVPVPLLSDGDFLVALQQGVLWHTRTPFDSSFILSSHGMYQQDGSAPRVPINTGEQAVAASLSRIFFALFTLDFEALAQDFETFGVRDGDVWKVGLKPRSSALAMAFSEVPVAGSGQIERIDLLDRHGDRTEIELIDVAVRHQSLTDQQRLPFLP